MKCLPARLLSVMITDLPKETRGIDADSLAEGNGETLKDEELAELLSSESPEKIRAAMPRMTPELRRIAEAVLKEPSKSFRRTSPNRA